MLILRIHYTGADKDEKRNETSEKNFATRYPTEFRELWKHWFWQDVYPTFRDYFRAEDTRNLHQKKSPVQLDENGDIINIETAGRNKSKLATVLASNHKTQMKTINDAMQQASEEAKTQR